MSVIAMLRHARRKPPIAVVKNETVFNIAMRKPAFFWLLRFKKFPVIQWLNRKDMNWIELRDKGNFRAGRFAVVAPRISIAK